MSALPIKAQWAEQMVDWQQTLGQKWATLRFGDVKVETDGEQHVFEVQVYLNDLDPKAVRVELYADGVKGSAPVRQEMKRVRPLAGASGGYVYRAAVPAARPASGLYGARDPALRRRGGSPGSRSHPLAAVNHPSTGRRTTKRRLMKESKKLKRMRPPTGRMRSESGQAAEQADATADLTTPERPLHEYLAEVCECTDVRVGVPLPLGTYARGEGVNFAFFSRHASRVRLELFDHPDDATAARVIDLDPARNRTGDVWHVWVEGIRPGQLYAYRVDGPYQPKDGHRFNFNKLLLDPFATAISRLPTWEFGPARGYDPSGPDGDSVCSMVDNAGAMPKCVFTQEHFHWHEDRPPRHPWSKTIIYETHVRGFTIHPSAGVEHPGTYRGLTEKIPYFQDLGVTAVELMPVQEFNEHQVIGINPHTGQPLTNYWGYDPVVFCAPKASYSSAGGVGQQKLEFREMVQAFHAAGIEVFLDVVFNHTAEGNEQGPTLCFRGIDNAIFYMLADDKRSYRDYTGTGNTMNANHPVVRDHILTALRYWVVEMHVDGFRFDLASVLGRGRSGDILPNAPLLERIAEDPILREVKIIAEAWDAAGAYEVGSFSERRWAEWNGQYRDDVRRFWRGDDGLPWCLRSTDLRQRRHLCHVRQRSREQHQFRHLSRWLHVARSRELSTEA